MLRFFYVPVLLSALALATPQTPADTNPLVGLPACAQDPAEAALAQTGCNVTDKNCVCSSQPFIIALTNTVLQDCSAADLSAALTFGQSFCGSLLAAGLSSYPVLSLSTPTSSAAGGGSSTPTSAPTASADDDTYNQSTTTMPMMTSTTSVSGAINSMSSPVTTAPSGSVTSMPTSGVVMTTTTQCTTTTLMTMGTKPYNSTFTGAAVMNRGQGIMAAAIGVAGAVALL